MDFYAFMRECYLHSNPSVDLDVVTKENPVNCGHHTLLISEFEKILERFVPDKNKDRIYTCNIWMLQSGPQLKEG